MRTSRKVKAAANLLRLGRKPDTIQSTIDSWVEFQRDSQISNISAMLKKLSEDSWQATKGLEGKLILSTHYGFYPALYLLLAKQTKDRRVAAIIGEQPDSHMVALQKLAFAHKIEIDFIKSSPRFLREVRNYLRLGRSAVLLVDVPWSQSPSKLDLWFEGPNGRIGTLQTLHRLSQAIDSDPVHCLAHYADGRHILNISHNMQGQSPLTILASMLNTAPQFYERLDSLDSYYDFDTTPDMAIIFKVDSKHYVYTVNDSRIWDVNESVNSSSPGEFGFRMLSNKQLIDLRQTIGYNLGAALGL